MTKENEEAAVAAVGRDQAMDDWDRLGRAGSLA